MNLNKSVNILELIIILFITLIILFIINKLVGFNILNVIPTIDSNITYGMLFITGILTSIHCISMCGAINLLATFNIENKVSLKRPFFYNLGRVISYTLIGGVVGFLGSIISINEVVNGIIILLAAFCMFFMSLSMMNIIKFKMPKLIKIRNNSSNSFVLGLFNGFMPCGPLQAMQVYALSTGSFVKGSLSMFLFSLGIVSLMLFVGLFFNIFKGNIRVKLNKIASILIMILSIIMINRGVSTLGFNIKYLFNDYKNYTSSIIKDDYQEVNIDLSYNSYDDIILLKGKKVRLIINVDKKYLTGCNETVVISKFNIRKKLKPGKNIIEFFPKDSGVYSMNCWMNMIKNNIKVIDDKDYFKRR